MPKKKKAKKLKNVKKTKTRNKNKVELKALEKKATSSSADEKPVIVKIKKQATEKRSYNLKDFVVYPSRGVGQILEYISILSSQATMQCIFIKMANVNHQNS